LKATILSNPAVDLKWSAATDNVGVQGYRIVRNGIALATVSRNTLSYRDASVAPGSTYAYYVEAFDAAGNRSPRSNIVTVTLANAADAQPPSVPTPLRLTAVSLTRVNLAWAPSTDNVGVRGYRIARDGKVLATVNASTLTYADTSVAAKRRYSYTVQAFDQAGNYSAAAGPLVVTTPPIRRYMPLFARN
jgi:chitodextrinase